MGVEDNIPKFAWKGEEGHARTPFRVVTIIIAIRAEYLQD
jgi:hypothetical protein